MTPPLAAVQSPALIRASTAATWADFVGLPDDDRRELFDGALLEVEVPTELHEHCVVEIATELKLWTRVNGGRVLGSGYKVRITDQRGVMPDVQFYRAGNPPPPDALTAGAPDLVVEVVSPSSMGADRVKKMEWYRQIGAAAYWIVDPETRSVQGFELRDAHWILQDQVALPTPDDDDGRAVLFAPAAFPGLEVNLRLLFAGPG